MCFVRQLIRSGRVCMAAGGGEAGNLKTMLVEPLNDNSNQDASEIAIH